MIFLLMVLSAFITSFIIYRIVKGICREVNTMTHNNRVAVAETMAEKVKWEICSVNQKLDRVIEACEVNTKMIYDVRQPLPCSPQVNSTTKDTNLSKSRRKKVKLVPKKRTQSEETKRKISEANKKRHAEKKEKKRRELHPSDSHEAFNEEESLAALGGVDTIQ